MATYPKSQRFFGRITKGLIDLWGRYADRSYWIGSNHYPPQSNPDTTTSDQYFDISTNPQIIAGMAFSDISHLFVSASGLEPTDDNPAYFPPQLIYTTQDYADQEVLDALAWQYDEEFQGGFSAIIKSLDDVCKSYGRCVGEIEWYVKQTDPYKGMAFARMIYSRDPEQYYFDYEGETGLFRYDGFGKYTRMDDNRFMWYAYNPLFNNPYGTSINQPLKPWVETFNKIFGYWRQALEKAGMGSWLAMYPQSWVGNTSDAKQRRADLLDQLGKLAAGTKGIFPEGVTIEPVKLQMEASAFLDWYNSFCEAVSLIYTGSTTTLKESEFGSRSAKESTDVREKAKLEQVNAARVSNAFTWRFNPLFCDLNFAPDRLTIYPTLQLISPTLITPTTPEGQQTTKENEAVEVDGEEGEIVVKTKPDEDEMEPEEVAEFQESDEPTEKQPPMAVPPTYTDFPATEPEPEIYADVLTLAEQELRALQVKPYSEVQPSEAANTFTIKRLRAWAGSQELLDKLRDAIVPTLAAPTEADAWTQYYNNAVSIFAESGGEMTPGIRDDLIISFRQARQNAFGRAIRKAALADDNVVAMRLQTKEDDRVRSVHKLWNNVILPKDNPLLERLAVPMDFGCRCNWLPVSRYEAAQYPLTPQSELPEVYPGDSYKYYAQPGEQKPTI